MQKRLFFVLSAIGGMAVVASGQNLPRQATITGGGGSDRGKCTIEVVVDGAAEVEIRGTSATLRNLSGQPAQWRRFQCTSAMPVNPVNFRFAGVDGRGRQELIRDPQSGGVAVVRIEDKDGGQEGYTFDLEWGGGYGRGGDFNGPRGDPNRVGDYGRGADVNGPRGDPNRVGGYRPDVDRRVDGDDGRYRPGWRNSDYYRRNQRGFGTEEAVQVCKDTVSRQASSRFRGPNQVRFLTTNLDNNPGRNDWVIGSLEVQRRGRDERYNFSCSVDFNTGRVRSATVDPRPIGF